MSTFRSPRLERRARRSTLAREPGPTHLLDPDERDEPWSSSGLNEDLELERDPLRSLVAVRARQVEDEFESQVR